jgi:hypothetical protein
VVLAKKPMDNIDIDMSVVVVFVEVMSIAAVGWESIDALRRSLVVFPENTLMRLN